jgi:GNAT superfamily N-acetyltransferase
MINPIKVISMPSYVSANWNHPSNIFVRGTISADLLYPEKRIWWISRAIIQPKEYRNQGIGSLLLKNVIEAIVQLNGSEIYVSPGGYMQDTKKQYNFYEKNGFILDILDQEEILVYSINS